MTVVAQAALKAAAGSTARATTPALRKMLQRARRDPKLVRRFEAWHEVKITNDQERALAAFMKSRECQGLLDMLAFVEYSRSGTWAKERQDLHAAFRAELASRLTLPDEVLNRIAADLWNLADGVVRLEVANLLGSGVSPSVGVYVRSLTTSSLFPDASSLSAPITARVGLSDSPTRVTAARRLTWEIKEAAKLAFSTVQMPHSRENYRVRVDRIYVHRSLVPARVDTLAGVVSRINDADLLSDHRLHLGSSRLVVLGTPGGGKTTYVRYLVYWLASSDDGTGAHAPLLVELKHYSSRQSDIIAMIRSGSQKALQTDVDQASVQDLLTLGYGTVIFDGLDEIADLEERRSAAAAIESFCRRYPLARIIVTAREVGYLTAPLDTDIFAAYVLPEFDFAQVRSYASRWFELVATPDGVPPEDRTASLLQDSKHVADLRANPLMLSLLCLLYVYDGWIPENRLQVYEECAVLLFDRWDKIRNVGGRRRGTRQVWYLFQELAYWFLFEKGAEQATASALRKVIEKFLGRNRGTGALATTSAEASDFLDFCAGRAWLLVRGGTNERGERTYDFTHRTFMEYFAACHITRHCESVNDLVAKVVNVVHEGSSDVVAQMALQQYDLRVADGLDKAIEQMLETAGLADASVMHFLVRSLHYFQPSDLTLLRLLRSALLLLALQHNSRIATDLAMLPNSLRSSFTMIAGDLMVSTADDLEVRRLHYLAGGLGHLIASKEVEGDNSGFRLFQPEPVLARGHRTALTGLATSHPHVVNEMLTSGLLPLDRYLQIVGPHAMIEPPANTHTIVPLRPPLLAELDSTMLTGIMSSWLAYMLAIVVSTPSSVFPISAATLADLRRSLDRRPVDPTLEGTLLRPGLSLLAIVAVCAAYDLGEDCAHDAQRLTGTLRHRTSRLEIGNDLFTYALDSGVNPTWLSIIRQWTNSALSFDHK